MALKSVLVGYCRLSRNQEEVLLSILRRAFSAAESHTSKDGEEFVRLCITTSKMRELLDGAREVTSVVQHTGDCAGAVPPIVGQEPEEPSSRASRIEVM